MTKITLYDNTRLASHRGCNRRYYYRHVRHLAGTGHRPALVFGAAWHAGMDAMWRGLFTDRTPEEIISGTFNAFSNEWVKQGIPPYDDMPKEQQEIFYGAKRTPVIATRMFIEYYNRRADFIRTNFKLLNVERPFIVPLFHTDEVLYVGRLDKVVEWNGGIWAIEHKTTGSGSAKNGFYRAWTESWSPNSQVDGYLYSLNMLFPGRAKGVLIDGALVHRTESHFDFVPVMRQEDQLEAWHYDTEVEISRIRENRKAAALSQNGNILRAYPKNTGTCIEYNSLCAYAGFCKTLPNPAKLTNEELTRTDEFRIEPWSPFDAAPLEDLGLTREMTGEPT